MIWKHCFNSPCIMFALYQVLLTMYFFFQLHNQFFDDVDIKFRGVDQQKEVKGAFWASTYLMPFLSLFEKEYVSKL